MKTKNLYNIYHIPDKPEVSYPTRLGSNTVSTTHMHAYNFTTFSIYRKPYPLLVFLVTHKRPYFITFKSDFPLCIWIPVILETFSYIILIYFCNHTSEIPTTLAIPAMDIFSKSSFFTKYLVSGAILLFSGFSTNCLHKICRMLLFTVMNRTIFHNIQWTTCRTFHFFMTF